MKYIFIITISLILASCGPSSEEKKGIAAVTCSIMGETRDIDAAVRVEKMNDARKEIGGEPFLEGDSVIQEAIEYGLCQELVLNENYEEMIIKAYSKPSIKEEFHENRQLKARVNYKGRKQHGLSEWYYENGQLERKGSWKDGKKHGLWETYDENGQLESKDNYKDGEYHGFFEWYHKNGQLWQKGSWKDGKKHGLTEWYYEDGQLWLITCYKNGERTDDSYCKPQ